jgi:hypothetical protein
MMVSQVEYYFERISKYLVGSYLNGVPELHRLSRTSKYMREIFKRKKFVRLILYRNLESLLLPFEIDINVFKHLMESTEAILSGSIVLQCFIGAKWDNSDVDIYLPYLGKTQRSKTVLRQYLNYFENYSLMKHKKKSKYMSKKYGNAICYVRFLNEFRHNTEGKTVQLIYVSKSLLGTVRNIVRSFDLSIVANYFTGSTWRFDHSKHILKRKMEFQSQLPYSSMLTKASFYRIIKYNKRGFRFKKNTRPRCITDELWNILDKTYDK